jgi:glycosyltransferase involved in cell wall biosynthesis
MCLECILKCGNNLIHEIIVVDNGSTDRTAEVVRKFEGVKLVNESKKSPTHARQKGYKEATGDLLAFIDADNHTNSSRAHKVHKAFASDPDLVFLSGPYVYYGNGSWRANPISRLCIRLFSYPGYLMTGCLGTGGNMIMKKTLLDTIG